MPWNEGSESAEMTCAGLEACQLASRPGANAGRLAGREAGRHHVECRSCNHLVQLRGLRQGFATNQSIVLACLAKLWGLGPDATAAFLHRLPTI